MIRRVSNMIKEHYRLAKPGIVYGNVFTTIAAFLYASRWHFSVALFLATVLGIAFVIASACVFNNYIDRDIDGRMDRTKNRALVVGKISKGGALLYASILGVAGSVILYALVNGLTTCVALIGFLFYVFVYTLSKRMTYWSTVLGSVAGAAPIVVGYTAVTDHFDLAALILFLILAIWQMPHFYAIAIRRIEEYRSAHIPVLPIAKGIKRTKIEIVCYIIAFIIATCSLTFFGFAGYSYLGVMLILGIAWFWSAVRGFDTDDEKEWAKKTFFFSLVMLVGFSLVLAFAPLLP